MKNHRKIFVSLLALFIFAFCLSELHAGGNRERYVNRSGGFSIAIPESWEVVRVRELNYGILRGAFVDGFAPTINFSDDFFEGSLSEYVIHIGNQLDEIFGENIEHIIQGEFTTAQGITGGLVVITTYQQGMVIQQNFYLLPGKEDRFLIITCTNLAEDHATYIPLFHSTVETFEWL